MILLLLLLLGASLQACMVLQRRWMGGLLGGVRQRLHIALLLLRLALGDPVALFKKLWVEHEGLGCLAMLQAHDVGGSTVRGEGSEEKSEALKQVLEMGATLQCYHPENLNRFKQL